MRCRLQLAVRRADFPALDEVTYLNTASVGLVPKSVFDRVPEFERSLALNGTTRFDEATELGVLEATRRAAARLFGADPDNVAIASSFTEALCQVAWWARPAVGTNVVSTDVDFPSVTYPWYRVAEESGCDVR